MIIKRNCKIFFDRFAQYIQKNRWYILIFYGLLMLVWMPWMQQSLPRIDTEVLINDPFSTNNWLTIGRQGGVFSRYLLGMARFNPLFAIIMGYLLVCVSGIVYGFLLKLAGGKDSISNLAFGFICFTCPIMAEQFYFDMQILMVGWAYIICGVSVGLSFYGIIKKEWLCCALAILGMVWTFCTYQIFAVLYVVLVLTCFLLLYWRWTVEEQCEKIQYWYMIGMLIGMFAVAFVANIIISNTFFVSGSYLDGQIFWGVVPWKQNLEYIFTHIKNAVTGAGIYFTPFYGLLALVTVATVLIQVCNLRSSVGYLAILASLGLQVTPFLLTVYLGGVPPYRAQLAYPMVLACNVVILFHILPARKSLRLAAIIISTVLSWTQTMDTMTLIYTDQVRAREDMYLAGVIEQRIIQVSDTEKPIAFIGTYDNQMTKTSVRGDIIGMSIFNCNDDIIPHYVCSTNRICELSQTFSIPFVSATADQIIEARFIALDMPCWPAKGSVADTGEFIIVKLSEDNWQEDFLQAVVWEVPLEESSSFIHNSIDWVAFDQIVVKDGILQIVGWSFLNNIDSREVTPALYLYDTEEDHYIKMRTVSKERDDLEIIFDSSLYKHAGFMALAPVSELKKDLDAYRLYVGLEYNNQWYLTQANVELPKEG